METAQHTKSKKPMFPELQNTKEKSNVKEDQIMDLQTRIDALNQSNMDKDRQIKHLQEQIHHLRSTLDQKNQQMDEQQRFGKVIEEHNATATASLRNLMSLVIDK